MPDTRAHRGPHPEDREFFAAASLPVLREAVADLAWLLGRGYAARGAVKLVGDRYQLAARQRMAIARVACSDEDLKQRRAREVQAEALASRRLLLDGYNVLTTIEAAMAGGVVLVGRDGTYRDLASMHGSFRRVEETRPALELLGRRMAALGVSEAAWYLDRPVGNSGRLKVLMAELAAASGWNWTVELVNSPDAVLVHSAEIIATADSVVLDGCGRWFNLARETVVRDTPAAWVVDLCSVDHASQ